MPIESRLHQSWVVSSCWMGVSRNTGVSKDELSRLSMRVEEMVSGINSDRLSNTAVSVVASGSLCSF